MIMKSRLIFLPAVILLAVSCNTVALSSIRAALPDMKDKPDGVYRGNYTLTGTPVKVTVDVTVQNQNITGIKIIKHSRSPIGKKAEKIIDTVIEKQSLDVDAVSGATGSSKAILKAVENALE